MLSTPNQVFSSTMTDSITFAKFEPILGEFANFQKFRQIKQTSKMLEPQLNYKNMSQVNHNWLKLSLLIKTHCFGDEWKISSGLDAIWWVAKWTNIPQRKTLKGIQVKSRRLQESTNMNVEYSTLSFFHQRWLIRSLLQSFNQFWKSLQTFKNSRRSNKLVKC